MPPGQNTKHLAGVHDHEAMVMLRTALSVGLLVGADMLTRQSGRQAMKAIEDSMVLSEHATQLIMSHMLRQVVSKGPPDPGTFASLVTDFEALAKEPRET